MSDRLKHYRGPQRRAATMLAATVAGFATAAAVGIALANTFTLNVATNAKVTNTMGVTKRENIAVSSRGFAVYDLTGDGQSHPKCTKANGCFQVWPPVTVASAKKLSRARALGGKLGIWHRDGFLQVMLGGHPLYRFAPDGRMHVATGEGIHSFRGTWHVIKASAPSKTTTSTPSSTTTTTTPQY